MRCQSVNNFLSRFNCERGWGGWDAITNRIKVNCFKWRPNDTYKIEKKNLYCSIKFNQLRNFIFIK